MQMLLRCLACSSAWLLITSLLTTAETAQGAERAPPAVTEVVFNAPILDIRWLGKESLVLLLTTMDDHIHRSTDGGKTFVDISIQIGGPSFKVLSIFSSPGDRNVVAVVGKTYTHFVSEDAGKTWRQMAMPAGRTRVMWFHDSRPQWALFSSWTHSCKFVEGPAVKGEVDDGGICSHALYATRDLGRTFVQITTHALQFDWGDAPYADRIYYSHFKDKSKDQPRFDHWMEDVNFGYTDDGTTFNTVIAGGNKFVISHGYIIVATVMNKELGLKVSKDAGSSFEKAVMPRHLKESSYIILDTSESSVVIHVNHGHGIGHIYASDEEGVHYTLSLENNVRGQSDCGFEKVKNLRGIYLANVRAFSGVFPFASSPGAPTPAPASPEQDSDESLLGVGSSKSQSDRGIRTLRDSSDRRLRKLSQSSLPAAMAISKVRSVISFDRGGAWTYLRPPEKDSLGKPIDCPRDSCWLHMHDITDFDRFVPFYSYTNAVGVIMGTGNVGPFLNHDIANTNTYLSRDGGLTWMEASKGDYIYEFGNHGGLLIMADWVSETRKVWYSSDQGHDWRSVQFSPQAMNISNILTEPVHAMTTKFVAFGTRGYQGVLYHLDFDAVGLRTCKGLSAADMPESDYETWTPSDGRSKDRCLLGRQVVYARRKQLANCLNNKNLEWPRAQKNCSCTEENFECSEEFHRGIESMECVPEHMEDFYKDENGRPGICAGKDFVSVDVYRKVSGDSCTGGWKPEALRLPCEAIKELATMDRKPHGKWFSWPLFTKMLVVVAGLVVLCCLYRSPSVRNCIVSLQLKITGQKDYSQPSSAPPSAANDPTNFGVPAKPTEMHAIP